LIAVIGGNARQMQISEKVAQIGEAKAKNRNYS
jgi:hypothetical protein